MFGVMFDGMLELTWLATGSTCMVLVAPVHVALSASQSRHPFYLSYGVGRVYPSLPFLHRATKPCTKLLYTTYYDAPRNAGHEIH